MLSIGGVTTRVYLAVGATDMRKGMDGLSGLVKSRLESDPTSGHLFVFCYAGRTRLKLIYFDVSGTWLCAKRLEPVFVRRVPICIFPHVTLEGSRPYGKERREARPYCKDYRLDCLPRRNGQQWVEARQEI